MGWEKRGTKLVYYRKERGADGRVRSIYCGSGERGELAAREDAERRSTRGPAEFTAHKKKAVAGDLAAAAVADGESPETYNPAAEAVAHDGLTDFRDIIKEGPPSPMTFFEACDYVREQMADGVSYYLAALLPYSAGRIDRETYQRLLEEFQPHYRKAR